MTTPFSKNLTRLRRLFAHVPPIDAVRLLALTAFRRRVAVRVRVNGVPLTVRTLTSDLRVAFACLAEGEFDDVDAVAPAVIVDGGANIGASAIALAEKYPDAIVIAIEPESENYRLLESNVRDRPNVRTLQAALAGDSTKRTLLDRGSGPWGFTITDSPSALQTTSQTVHCLTVEDVMERFGVERIDLLKLDIEGGERDVFATASGWIDRVGAVVIELHEDLAPGCEAAFDAATTAFPRRTSLGEKIAVYRT